MLCLVWRGHWHYSLHGSGHKTGKSGFKRYIQDNPCGSLGSILATWGSAARNIPLTRYRSTLSVAFSCLQLLQVSFWGSAYSKGREWGCWYTIAGLHGIISFLFHRWVFSCRSCYWLAGPIGALQAGSRSLGAAWLTIHALEAIHRILRAVYSLSPFRSSLCPFIGSIITGVGPYTQQGWSPWCCNVSSCSRSSMQPWTVFAGRKDLLKQARPWPI